MECRSQVFSSAWQCCCCTGGLGAWAWLRWLLRMVPERSLGPMARTQNSQKWKCLPSQNILTASSNGTLLLIMGAFHFLNLGRRLQHRPSYLRYAPMSSYPALQRITTTVLPAGGGEKYLTSKYGTEAHVILTFNP